MHRVRQPHTLVVLGLNAEMGTAAGADELGEVPHGEHSRLQLWMTTFQVIPNF